VSFEQLKSEIIDTNLCEGCGLCAGFCKAITLEETIPTLTGKCMLTRGANECGLCYELCPQAHPEEITPDALQPLGSAAFRTTNEKLADSISNGGFVTGIIAELLQKKKVDAVTAVTGTKRAPEALTITKPSEVAQLAGTRYSPSGVMNALADSMREHGKNVAVVGLPCEMRGVKRLEDRIDLSILKIGLFCSNNNKINEEGKTEKLGSCAHCTDFFATHADIACGFSGAEKGYTSVLALTERGEALLNDALKSKKFDRKEVDMSKVKAAQTRKSKRETLKLSPTLRERVLEEIVTNGPGEISDIASRMKVTPSDIFQHLLVLQFNGEIKSIDDRSNPYRVVWCAN
jgi:coenzyme F420 hydrogenase subunit beta